MSNLYSINVAHTRGHVTRTLSGVIAATFLSCYVPVFAKKRKKKTKTKRKKRLLWSLKCVMKFSGFEFVHHEAGTK